MTFDTHTYYVFFRRFPFKNEDLLKVWIDNIGLRDFCPDERSPIAMKILRNTFYKRKTGGFILKSSAFPTVFSESIFNGITNIFILELLLKIV